MPRRVQPNISAVPSFDELPVRVDRRTGAALVSQYYFPVSWRTLEVWPLTWRRVNGKAVADTAALFKVAEAKLRAATPIRSARRSPNSAT
jgi:hypothetical protein